MPLLFALLYVVSLGLLAGAAWRIGRVVYASPWTNAALLAALTLRHAVTRTGTNTLEGYFHPRQLAFGLCVLALASFLRGRLMGAVLLVVAGGLFHPTTALWFGISLGVAALIDRPERWRWLAGAAVPLLAAAVWALVWGPLRGRLDPMDAAWLATLEGKTYLFPLAWPASAWIANLAYAPLIGWGYLRRRRAGLARPHEGALVAGMLALVPLFVATLPLNARHVQLAIQIQPARVFWLLDLWATIYVVWLLAEGWTRTARRARLVAGVVAALAATRGLYTGFLEFPDRPTVSFGIKDDDWGRAMAWLRATPADTFVLADPMHALIYGSSVRVAAERDVFVEASKDQAIGMYGRGVAMRTRDRTREVGEFGSLTPGRARDLAARYGLDYLVSEAPLDLPVAFSSGSLRVYALTPRR